MYDANDECMIYKIKYDKLLIMKDGKKYGVNAKNIVEINVGSNKILYNVMNGRPSMSIWLEKRLKYHCLLDTGAKINVISSSIINKLNMLDKINECAIQVTCANKSSLVILGTIMIEITISPMVRIIKFYVAEKLVLRQLQVSK